MSLDEPWRQFLADVMERRREEIVDSATDWVVGAAVDLRRQRPREETRRLVDRNIAGYEAALLRDDLEPISAFIEFVTSFRASSEFHVSTLLRGFLAFRRALLPILRVEAREASLALDVIAAVDDVYFTASLKTADLYEEKLVGTILQRRQELERELGELTERKTRELDEKMRVIEEQRATLAALSVPLIRVWKDVLVLPLIGAWGRERANEIKERALVAIRSARARVLIIDITGLTEVNDDVTRHLPELVRAANLLGAEALLVGVRPAAARAFVDIDADLSGIRAFASLYDGLRATLATITAEERKRRRK